MSKNQNCVTSKFWIYFGIGEISAFFLVECVFVVLRLEINAWVAALAAPLRSLCKSVGGKVLKDNCNNRCVLYTGT